MRVLVTGASGYIGVHVVRELLGEGHEVTAVVRSPARLGSLPGTTGLRVVTADLLERRSLAEALEGQDVCVHAALSWGQPGSELDLPDTAIAARLFDDAGRAGVARCVYLSSASVHRPFAPEMDEDDRLTTSDYYGATKAAGEVFLRAACATHDMSGVVIRPGPVVGPPAFPGGSFRSDRRLADMVGAAMRAVPIEVPARAGRQWCDVATLAKVTRLLACAADPYPTYVCVDSEILRWEWIAQTIVDCLRSPSPVRVLPSSPESSPRFRTRRIEELLGGPMDSRAALVSHLHEIVQASP